MHPLTSFHFSVQVSPSPESVWFQLPLFLVTLKNLTPVPTKAPRKILVILHEQPYFYPVRGQTNPLAFCCLEWVSEDLSIFDEYFSPNFLLLLLLWVAIVSWKVPSSIIFFPRDFMRFDVRLYYFSSASVGGRHMAGCEVWAVRVAAGGIRPAVRRIISKLPVFPG